MSLNLTPQQIKEALELCLGKGQVMMVEVEGQELYFPLPDRINLAGLEIRLGTEWVATSK